MEKLQNTKYGEREGNRQNNIHNKREGSASYLNRVKLKELPKVERGRDCANLSSAKQDRQSRHLGNKHKTAEHKEHVACEGDRGDICRVELDVAR